MANTSGSVKEINRATPITEKTVFAVQAPYAEMRVSKLDAYDHASMRAKQLSALTLLITGDGFEVFSNLGAETQHDALWLLQQLAAEIQTMIPIISDEENLITAKRIEA